MATKKIETPIRIEAIEHGSKYGHRAFAVKFREHSDRMINAAVTQKEVREPA